MLVECFSFDYFDGVGSFPTFLETFAFKHHPFPTRIRSFFFIGNLGFVYFWLIFFDRDLV